MHQIEIKVIDTAGFQLLFKHRTDVRFGIEILFGKLVGQNVAVSWISFGKAFSDGDLTLFMQIAMSGIEVVEASFQVKVKHFTDLIHDDVLVFVYRQSHAAETELVMNFREKLVLRDKLLSV